MAADYQDTIHKRRLELHTTVFALSSSPCGNYLAACNNFGHIAVFSLVSALAPDSSSDKKRPIIFFQGCWHRSGVLWLNIFTANLFHNGIFLEYGYGLTLSFVLGHCLFLEAHGKANGLPRAKLENCLLLKTDTGHTGPIYSLISTDKFLISGGSSEIHGWRWDEILDKTECPSPAWTLQPPARNSLDVPETNALVFANQDDILFSGCGDNNIYMWDLESGTCKNTLTGHTDYVQCLCLRTKHSQCISGAEDGTVRLWDYRTKGTMTGIIEPCKNEDIHRPTLGSWIGCVNVDESQDWLVCGGGPSLSVWHLRSMACTSVLKTASTQQTALFHDDLILSAGSEPTIFHWQINGDSKSHVPCTSKSVFAMQVNDKSPTNKVLTVGGSSADIDVFTNFGYRALSLKFSQ